VRQPLLFVSMVEKKIRLSDSHSALLVLINLVSICVIFGVKRLASVHKCSCFTTAQTYTKHR
jgi:hypothetical protein